MPMIFPRVAPRAMLVSEEGEESVIPYHRVRIIRRGDIVIWERKRGT
jgi:uncharacterized protein (UPF0248 family)